MQPVNVAGMMSGTSLDGIDLVLCSFSEKEGKWHYKVQKAVTLPYSEQWINALSNAQTLNTEDFILLHNDYGKYIGNCIMEFLGCSLKARLAASHGHTIFHQPSKGMTFQIGNGANIAAECGITVVSDFRSTDVALGGHGAPLVPVGDKLLFGEYDFCLNLGGFANISHDRERRRIAFDICPVNLVANSLSRRIGLEYDCDGMVALRGMVIHELVEELDNLEFYGLAGPKSLGREWVESDFMPVMDKYDAPVPDLLRSFYTHVAGQISKYVNSCPGKSLLVTGGGAFNKFLTGLIRDRIKARLVIPEDTVVKYKEAIIFAFLGLLRYHNRINCLSSVTGARKDSSAGSIFLP